jgi:hypothetical protein
MHDFHLGLTEPEGFYWVGKRLSEVKCGMYIVRAESYGSFIFVENTIKSVI